MSTSVAAWKDRDIETALNVLRIEMIGLAQKMLPALDAEDAVQIAMMWCWEHRADFRGSRRDLRSWLFKVMRRVILSTARTVKRRQDNEHEAVIYGFNRDTEEWIESANSMDFLLDENDPTVQLIERLAAEPEREQLWDLICLAELSERQVEVLTHKLGEWTNREIAERLGTTRECVNGHYAAAVKKIRDAHRMNAIK